MIFQPVSSLCSKFVIEVEIISWTMITHFRHPFRVWGSSKVRYFFKLIYEKSLVFQLFWGSSLRKTVISLVRFIASLKAVMMESRLAPIVPLFARIIWLSTVSIVRTTRDAMRMIIVRGLSNDIVFFTFAVMLCRYFLNSAEILKNLHILRFEF